MLPAFQPRSEPEEDCAAARELRGGGRSMVCTPPMLSLPQHGSTCALLRGVRWTAPPSSAVGALTRTAPLFSSFISFLILSWFPGPRPDPVFMRGFRRRLSGQAGVRACPALSARPRGGRPRPPLHGEDGAGRKPSPLSRCGSGLRPLGSGPAPGSSLSPHSPQQHLCRWFCGCRGAGKRLSPGWCCSVDRAQPQTRSWLWFWPRAHT